jgi:hypothetical protein
MNVFQTHSQIIKDYETYIHSFLKIYDLETNMIVEQELSRGKLWPEPLLQWRYRKGELFTDEFFEDSIPI